MPNDQSEPPGDDQDHEITTASSLVEQIVDATLEDSRVTEKVSSLGITELRKTLLAERLSTPDELVAAANLEERSGEIG